MNNSTLTRVVVFRQSLPFLFLLLCSFFSADCQRTRANLLIVDANGGTLMDGNMTNYSDQYSNLVDNYDIWKASNFGENFGILRSTANLVIERRKTITSNDTTYFRMWNLKQRNYTMQVIIENMQQSNLTGFVHDNFTSQDILVDLNDTSYINFSVTSQAGSFASNRFQLIFLVPQFATLPCTFTSLQAYRKNSDVQINWEVENEISMDKYIVEVSSNAIHFNEVKQAKAVNSSLNLKYNAQDLQVPAGERFYRIKAISIGGKVQYSSIVKIAASRNVPDMSVFPNPVMNKNIGLQTGSLAAGMYQMKLVDASGKTVHNQKITVQGPGTKLNIALPTTTPAGAYFLKLSTASEILGSIPVLIR